MKAFSVQVSPALVAAKLMQERAQVNKGILQSELLWALVCDAHTDADRIQPDIIKSLIHKTRIMLWGLCFAWGSWVSWLYKCLISPHKYKANSGRQSYLEEQLLWLPKTLCVYFYLQFFFKRVSALQCVKIISLCSFECLTIRVWTTPTMSRSSIMECCFDAWFHSQFGAGWGRKESKAEFLSVSSSCSLITLSCFKPSLSGFEAT